LRGAAKKRLEELGCDFGHITGKYQIPIRVRGGERGVYTGERPITRISISYDWISEITIGISVADQTYMAGRTADLIRNMSGQCKSMKRQQGFISAHPGTAAANQDKARAIHAKMITLKVVSAALIRWPRYKT
jgi:hypothetical protein